MDRITDLAESIFSADDLSVGDTSNSHLASSTSTLTTFQVFRKSLATSEGLPLLQTDTLRKLGRLLATCSTQDKGADLAVELEESGLARLLKILERSWTVAEGVEPWESDALGWKAEEEVEVTKQKGKGKARKESPGTRRSSRSRSPTVGVQDQMHDDDSDDDESEYWTADVLNKATSTARVLSDALLAIRCALVILTSTDLPQKLYSVDMLSALLATIRHSTTAFLYPLLTCSPSSHLAHLPTLAPTSLSSVVESLSSTIPLFAAFVHSSALDDSLVISTLYFALSPFLHDVGPVATKGRRKGNPVESAMRGIRVESLGLVRTVFGRSPEQRSWVVQEVLDNLTRLEIAKKGKGSFRFVNFS